MKTLILVLHEVTSGILVLIALWALYKLGRGLSRKTPYDVTAQRLMTAFSIGAGLQCMVGIGLLVTIGNFNRAGFWIHAGTMLVSTAVATLHRRWRGAPDAVRYRNGLLLVVGVVTLMVVGILLLAVGATKKTA